MIRMLCCVSMAVALVACGGGGGGSADGGGAGTPPGATAGTTAAPGSSAPAQASAGGGSPAAQPQAALAAQPATRANTTTAGDQALRAVGALDDGGSMVAWLLDGQQLFAQRHDGAGNRVGGEVRVPLTVMAVTPAATSAAIADSAVAVDRKGRILVAYSYYSDVPQAGGLPTLTRSGVYVQGFDASGAQVLPETEVVSRVQQVNSRSPYYRGSQVVALSDGGFAVGWMDVSPSSVNIRSTVYHQRFDALGRAVGGARVAGSASWAGTTSFTLAADARAGYMVSTTQLDGLGDPVTSIVHLDAANAGRDLVAQRAGRALAVALAGDRYALFVADAQGATRQFLDATGRPVGAPLAIPALPDAAVELADASFVLVQSDVARSTLRQFEPSGAQRGAEQATAVSEMVPAVAALTPGGLVLGWSAATVPGDRDVYTQRFR